MTSTASANFEGHGGRECGEHRTVGSHRAWCYDCSEWCYPEFPCSGCKIPQLEAKLQERDREIHGQSKIAARWLVRALEAETALTEANQFLEQTIEVLGDLQTWMVCYPHLYSLATEKWWNLRAKPLLDNLKALTKEGTE